MAALTPRSAACTTLGAPGVPLGRASATTAAAAAAAPASPIASARPRCRRGCRAATGPSSATRSRAGAATSISAERVDGCPLLGEQRGQLPAARERAPRRPRASGHQGSRRPARSRRVALVVCASWADISASLLILRVAAFDPRGARRAARRPPAGGPDRGDW